MELKRLMLLPIIGLLAVSCTEEELSDAYGQFEAVETVISAEASGRLQTFDVQEGDHLEAGRVIGQIDSTQPALRKKELMASLSSMRNRVSELDAQAAIYRSQLQTAETELARLESLYSENAATQQQIDAGRGQVETLNRQIDAVEVQKQSVYSELETLQVRIEQVEDQLSKTVILNPVFGTVLNTFAEPHELVTTGSPLYQIANLDEMILRAYVSGAQLPGVQIGAAVDVLMDETATENRQLTGTVSWVSSEAEFTPRMIQTKEERVTQVYAVKIRVENPDGRIKIGMPGEVNF
ncbi:MAG: HlyD family efflux transporter periplasmic adaptor subunit [Balneolaceae bacterium]